MADTKEIQARPEHSGEHVMFCNSGLHSRIAEAAYFKAEHRGFAPGHELDDWLGAEQDVLVREGIIHRAKNAVHEPRMDT